MLFVISALVVMVLFQKLVGPAPKRMAEFCSKININHLDTPLQLDRRPRQDELEQVVTAVNSLQKDCSTILIDVRLLNDCCGRANNEIAP